MTNGNDVPGAGVPQGPPSVPPVVEPGQADRETNRDARMWAMLGHLTGLLSFIGPLVVWLIKKEEFPFVDEQGKEALNFQITMLIYGFVAGLTMFICIGFLLGPAVWIVDVVFLIIATIKANDGYHYRYPWPLIIRLIK